MASLAEGSKVGERNWEFAAMILRSEGNVKIDIGRVDRIAIIGPSGSGKSTLAREVGRLLGLPVVHIDSIYWKPGWIEPSREEFEEKIRELVGQERWVMDGNYSRTFGARLPRADLVIYLDFPRRIYFRRAVLRTVKNYGKTRIDLGPGCPEKFDLEFYRFVWRIPKDSRPRTIRRLEELGVADKLICLRGPADVKEFLNLITSRSGQ